MYILEEHIAKKCVYKHEVMVIQANKHNQDTQMKLRKIYGSGISVSIYLI